MLLHTLTKFFLFIVTVISISTGLAFGDSAEVTISSDTSTDGSAEVITSSETSTGGSAQPFSEPNKLNLFYENGTLALENENYEEAILSFDKALKIDQNHISQLLHCSNFKFLSITSNLFLWRTIYHLLSYSCILKYKC